MYPQIEQQKIIITYTNSRETENIEIFYLRISKHCLDYNQGRGSDKYCVEENSIHDIEIQIRISPQNERVVS